MPQSLSLLRAILAEHADAAEAILHQALETEVDPLRWCAQALGIAEGEVMRRAADWAGMAFFDTVPVSAIAALAPDRLENFADARMLRLRVLDRDVAFAAPDFFGMVRLRRMVTARPELHGRICIVPRSAIRDYLVRTSGPALLDNARQTLTRHWPRAVAQLELTRPARWFVLLVLASLLSVITIAPLAGHLWAIPVWFALVVLPALIRLAALLTPPLEEPPVVPVVNPAELPLYSILVPLRDEANMVNQIVASLRRLDYPPARLEVIFVVESRSPGTLHAVRRNLRDPRFSLVVVPDAPPRTKPKALGFALPLCRGEFVVVFDAEDRPEPDQLQKVVAQFRARPDVDCIQARLVIANGRTGWLPAVFAGEYAALFAVILPALARWGAVTPLGGTSNHFRLATLRALGGWDSYNVTEDADLGVRLARRRLKVATSTSCTFEDAPAKLRPWLGQRTRWIKGWLQTFVVHGRRPAELWADLGWRGFLLFKIIVLGMILSPFLHICMALVFAFGVLSDLAGWSMQMPWPPFYLAIMLVGYGAALLTHLFGLHRTGQMHLLAHQMVLPVYWLLIGVATLRAAVEFARQPFYWFKTPHDVAQASGRPIPQSVRQRMPLRS